MDGLKKAYYRTYQQVFDIGMRCLHWRTRGGLTDVKVAIKHSLSRSKACREKSAEVIVPGGRKRTGKD